ncbi:hypothetical protein BH18ACT5_BH18ACT5_14440 [soil metagenome]
MSVGETMAESKWERLAAGAGLIFVVLFLGALSDPVIDPVGDGAAVVAGQLLDNRGQGRLAVYAGGLAALALVWFVGSLRSTLRRAEGGTGRLSAVAFGGGVMAGGTLLASTAFSSAALEFADYGDDPAGARLAAGFAEHLFYFTNFGMALLVGATFVLALRHQAIPLWLAWVGAVGGALSLVLIWPFFVLGVIVFLFWVAALSIVLLRRVARTPG